MEFNITTFIVDLSGAYLVGKLVRWTEGIQWVILFETTVV